MNEKEPGSRFILLPEEEQSGGCDIPVVGADFPVNLLLQNIGWFCRLRWLVILALVLFAVSGLFFPGLYASWRLVPQIGWPLAAAFFLALMNFFYLRHYRTAVAVGHEAAVGCAIQNLWTQIIVDLAVLTVAVHFIGSLTTPVAMAYLFHVVLACIFFPRRHSLGVTLAAIGFYLVCLLVETLGLVSPTGILSSSLTVADSRGLQVIAPLLALPLTMLVVWYLASQLSGLLQLRNRELFAANHRLQCLQREKMRHVLRTTHELKAPFAAIHANLQLLLKGYCGALPAEAVEVVESTARRARMLSDGIKEMLQLANLHEESGETPPSVRLDLAEVVEWCVTQSRQVAEEKGIRLVLSLQPVTVHGNEDHLKMLFTNLIFNAILYSHRGGQVDVETTVIDGAARARIRDRGIGIPADKLPLIFQEYYRTREAMAHNPESTGLGMAIVRRVAARHGIVIELESETGRGTTFTLVFPRLDTRAFPGETD